MDFILFFYNFFFSRNFDEILPVQNLIVHHVHVTELICFHV